MQLTTKPYTTSDPILQCNWPILRPFVSILPTAYLLILRALKKQTPDTLYLSGDPGRPNSAHVFMDRYILRIFYLPKSKDWVFSFMYEKKRVTQQILAIGTNKDAFSDFVNQSYANYGHDTFFTKDGIWYYTQQPADLILYHPEIENIKAVRVADLPKKILPRPILAHPDPVKYLVAEPFQAPESRKPGRGNIYTRNWAKYIYNRIFMRTTTIL